MTMQISFRLKKNVKDRLTKRAKKMGAPLAVILRRLAEAYADGRLIMRIEFEWKK